jgi:methyl-accepting chemotaxis protein-1 (serine sensor receptor)
MFKNLTVGMRLALLVTLLVLATALVGACGLRGTQYSNDKLRTVYEDRTVPLLQIGRIMDAAFQMQANLARAAVAARSPDVQRALQENARLDEEANGQWKAYLATYLTPDEKLIAEAFSQAWTAYERQRNQLERLLQDDPGQAAGALPQLDQAFAAARGQLMRLRQLQDDVAREEFAAATASAATTLRVNAALLVIGVVAGVAISWRLIRSLQRELGGEPSHAAQVVREVAAGHLGVQVKLRDGDEDSLLAAMRQMVDKLSQTVGAVRAASDTINMAADEIAMGNKDLAERTERQASNIEETAATMEELTGAVRTTADNAGEANRLMAETTALAERSGSLVAEVIGTMGAIRDSSARIADIINVIDSIAFQTNILALNAAVEAARAGEQGRGFAVVAQEVRSLAHRVTQAAHEVKDLIVASETKVDEGSKQVDTAGEAMHQIVESVQRVATLMQDIASASREQSAGIAQVNATIAEMDSATQQNASLVEEAAATSASMQQQAHAMADVVSVFHLPGADRRLGMRAVAGLPEMADASRQVTVRKVA